MTEPEPDPQKSGFIFQDLQGRRWPRLRRVLVLRGLVLVLAVVWFFRALFIHPELHMPAIVRSLKGQLKIAIRAEKDDPKALSFEKKQEQLNAKLAAGDPDPATIARLYPRNGDGSCHGLRGLRGCRGFWVRALPPPATHPLGERASRYNFRAIRGSHRRC